MGKIWCEHLRGRFSIEIVCLNISNINRPPPYFPISPIANGVRSRPARLRYILFRTVTHVSERHFWPSPGFFTAPLPKFHEAPGAQKPASLRGFASILWACARNSATNAKPVMHRDSIASAQARAAHAGNGRNPDRQFSTARHVTRKSSNPRPMTRNPGYRRALHGLSQKIALPTRLERCASVSGCTVFWSVRGDTPIILRRIGHFRRSVRPDFARFGFSTGSLATAGMPAH